MEPVGVVVGRFQVPRLHEGHKAILARAAMENARVLVIVGSANAPVTKRNPLTRDQRVQMVLRELHGPHYVRSLNDFPTNEQWVEALHTVAQGLFPDAAITLYSDQKGCGETYIRAGGKWPVVFTDTTTKQRGTDIRANVKETYSPDFRAGTIHAIQRQFTSVYPVVDVAIYNAEGHVLLGQKPTDGDNWRLIGGFVDPKDPSLEFAARREVLEETGLEVASDLKYCGSRQIDDWRYRGCEERILSSVFRAQYIWGRPKASDDIAKLMWFELEAAKRVIHPNHKDIFKLTWQ